METNELLKPILIEGLLRVSDWCKSENHYFLRSIFDLIGFKKRFIEQVPYFVLPVPLSTKINYPIEEDKQKLIEAKKNFQKEIDEKYRGLSLNYLNELTANQLLFLLEKLGSYIPLDENGTTCLYDEFKIKCAQTILDSNKKRYKNNDNVLICIDISGIQKFIYNISSTGALKNLRARSFFIELLCNHVIHKVLNAFQLGYVNVFMNGGGTIYILSAYPNDFDRKLKEINSCINKWLLDEFNGLLYAVISSERYLDDRINNELKNTLLELSKKTFEEKRRKFHPIIEEEKFNFIDEFNPVYPGCEICSKDDPGKKYYKISNDDERTRCFLSQS